MVDCDLKIKVQNLISIKATHWEFPQKCHFITAPMQMYHQKTMQKLSSFLSCKPLLSYKSNKSSTISEMVS